MNKSTRRKALAEGATPASKGRDPRPSPAKQERDGDWEAIERAVYDGMQDLRERKPGDQK
jgi:hypothetical protein